LASSALLGRLSGFVPSSRPTGGLSRWQVPGA